MRRSFYHIRKFFSLSLFESFKDLLRSTRVLYSLKAKRILIRKQGQVFFPSETSYLNRYIHFECGFFLFYGKFLPNHSQQID